MNTQLPLLSHKAYLDGWRGVAILLVLIGHFFPNDIINLGRVGVDLFFVLSGFLMGQLLFVKQVALKTFYKRRVARIFPTMLVFLLTMLLIAPLFKLETPLIPFLMAGSFTINYIHALGLQSSHLFEHFWSLSVEEHSYLMLGLIAFIARHFKLSPLPFIGVLMVAMIINGYVSTLIFKQTFYQSYWRSDVACAAIFMSAFLATWQLNLKRLPLWFLIIGGLVLVYISMNRFPIYAVKYSLGTAILAFTVVNLDKAPEFVRNALSIKPLCFLGTISYSLYLWQQFFYVLAKTYPAPLMLLAALSVGYLSYRFIETPARQWLNENW